MPIPKWVERWLEKIDDPIIDITCVTVDIGDMVAEDVILTETTHRYIIEDDAVNIPQRLYDDGEYNG